jgi:hypothetical protein
MKVARQIVEADHVIGVAMADQHGIDLRLPCGQELTAHVGPRVYEEDLSVGPYQERRSGSSQ